MSDRATGAVAVALGAGLCGAVQPKINAALGSRVGSALLASLVNFSVALAFVLVALALRPGTRRRLAGLRRWEVPRWALTGGFGGAVVVLAGAVTVDTIGVAVFSIGFFGGQIAFGLLVDGLGVSPGGKRTVTASRVQAVLLAVAAVVLSQAGRPVGELAPALVVFVVAAGAASAFQAAFNGRITLGTGDPVAATAVNVAVGTVALVAVAGALAAGGHLDGLRWPSEPWLYTGGALGVTVVLSLAIATAALGVLRTTLAMLAAQLIGAFLVDWLVERRPPTAGVVAGAVLIVGAVALVGRRALPAPALADPRL